MRKIACLLVLILCLLNVCSSSAQMVGTPTFLPKKIDAIRAALSQAGCASCATYDSATTGNWVNVTAAEYARVALISGAGKYVANDSFMSNTPAQGYVANVTMTMGTTQTQVAANNYIIAFSIRTGPSGVFSNGTSLASLKLKASPTAITSGYADVAPAVSNPTSAILNTLYYWVRKRPTSTVGGASVFIAAYHSPQGVIGLATSGTNYSAPGDANTFSSSAILTPFIQVIGTPTKQW